MSRHRREPSASGGRAGRTLKAAVAATRRGTAAHTPLGQPGRYRDTLSHHLIPGSAVDVQRLQAAINTPRAPRHYVFKHVATRTASNFITSENLWGSKSREPYAGPPRGLHSPRDKPYLCNGTPDLVLTSLNHVRARQRVASQIAAKRNEDAGLVTQQYDTRVSDQAAGSRGGGIPQRTIRPFFPSAQTAAQNRATAKRAKQQLRIKAKPRDLYHVRPVHKLARRCNLDRANGFEMLKSQLQDSNQRVKAMRSGNTSIFHMGDVHADSMHAVKVGENSVDAISAVNRARGALARESQLRARAAPHRPPSSGRPGSRPASGGRNIVPSLDLRGVRDGGSGGDGDGGAAGGEGVEPYREFVEEVMNKFLKMIAKYTGDTSGADDSYISDGAGASGGVTSGSGHAAAAEYGVAVAVAGGLAHDQATDARAGSGPRRKGEGLSIDGSAQPTPALQNVYKAYEVLMEELSPEEYATAAFKAARHGGLVGLSFPGTQTTPSTPTNFVGLNLNSRPPAAWSDDDVDLSEQRPNGERVCRTPSPTSYLPLSDRRVASPPTHWPSFTARTKQAVKAKARIEARHNSEANRRDRLFREFMNMEAPVVPPALARASHWGFGSALVSQPPNNSSVWGASSAQGSRSALRGTRVGGRSAAGPLSNRTSGFVPPGSAMAASWFGHATRGNMSAPGSPRAGPILSEPLKLARGPVTARADHAETLGVSGPVGLGDKFEVDKEVLTEALGKLLASLSDEHEDTMRYKFRAFTEVLNEQLNIPVAQQLKGVRILAELFRVRELRARISGTDWYDKLLTLVSQTSAADGVTASERYCLKLTLEVLHAGLPFGRDALESIAIRLSKDEHMMPAVQRILAYLRRLVRVPLKAWDDFLAFNGLPQSLESSAQELYDEASRHYQWLRQPRNAPASTTGAAGGNVGVVRGHGRRGHGRSKQPSELPGRRGARRQRGVIGPSIGTARVSTKETSFQVRPPQPVTSTEQLQGKLQTTLHK